MKDIVAEYAKLVEFLGVVMGDNCEVVLQDVRKGKNCITAIANGHISGRSVGAPLTDFGNKILTEANLNQTDVFYNYAGVTKSNKRLRSSTYVIRDNGKIVAFLCINIDDNRYLDVCKSILAMAGIRNVDLNRAVQPACSENDKLPVAENFYEDANELIDAAINEYFASHGINHSQRLLQEDKIEIVRKLSDIGAFMVKGSIRQVAAKLGISENSLYRYLSKVNHKKQPEKSIQSQII